MAPPITKDALDRLDEKARREQELPTRKPEAESRLIADRVRRDAPLAVESVVDAKPDDADWCPPALPVETAAILARMIRTQLSRRDTGRRSADAA